MKPGAEMDWIVAEKVLGHTLVPEPIVGRMIQDNGPGTLKWHVPPYSTEIGPAWGVVKARLSCDGHFAFWPHSSGKLEIRYHGIRTWDSEPRWEIVGETPAHAICIAALKACGVEVTA